MPATCSAGDLFYNLAAAPGANLFGCTAANTWSPAAGNNASITSITSNDGTLVTAIAGSSLDISVNETLIPTATSNIDLTGANTIGFGGSGFISITVPNEGTTGTVLDTLTSLSGATAILASAGATGGIVGITVSGAGTNGNARIATAGWALCQFDGATAAGDYVQISPNTSGQCHDAGSARPLTGQILGRVTSNHGGQGSYAVLLNPDVTGIAPGLGIPGGSNGQLQYNNNSGGFGGVTLGGDCSFSVPNITCTQTNGISFAAVATSGSAGDLNTGTLNNGRLATNTRARAFGYSFDGGGSALSPGLTKYLTVPFACTLSAWNILTDGGTVTITTWKAAAGTAIPTAGNSISTSGVSISSGTAVHSSIMTDFTTTAVSANDIFAFNVSAATQATYINFILECDQ